MRALLTAAALALGMGGPSAAMAQETGDDIIVQGGVEDLVRSFVGEVSVAPGSENQLARWDRRVCTGIVGLRDVETAQRLADRIAQQTFAVGLEPGAAGCRPNVMVFVTPDSDRLAAEIATEFREYVGYFSGDQDAITRGQAELTAFVETPRPVRWWHVSQTVTEDGQRLAAGETQMSRSGGFRGAQVARVRDAGRLRRTTRQDFNRVLIIVDAQRSAGASIDALGDYLAMVALAQLDPAAETAHFATILNLFADPADGASRPAALTDWDSAYLEGLYGAPRAARNARSQEGAISRTMNEALTPQP